MAMVGFMADDTAGIRRRWTAKLTVRRRTLAAARTTHDKALGAVRAAKRVLARHPAPKPVPAKPVTWHPEAIRVAYASAGPFTVGRPKITWHTTEGSSLPTYPGSAPHITFDPKTGKIYQHIGLNEAAKALQHPAGTPETNRARVVQVELLAYSDTALAKRHGHPERAVVNFTDGDYARIAELARWIERNAGVPRTCGVEFTATAGRQAKRLSGPAFVNYTGHLGHEHVPGNFHWDPTTLNIRKVLA